MLALRIREGIYLKKGFGLLPKMLVWGVLGVVIASAMTIFKTGTLALLDGGFHLDGKAAEWFKADLSWGKVFVALCISVLMNTLFAPVFMTFHKITDIHIAETGGSLKGFFGNKLKMRETMSQKNQLGHAVWFYFCQDYPAFLVSGSHHNVFASRYLPSAFRVLPRRCSWRDSEH